MDIAFDEVAEEDDDEVLNSNSTIDIDDDIEVVSFKDYDKSLDEIDNDTVHWDEEEDEDINGDEIGDSGAECWNLPNKTTNKTLIVNTHFHPITVCIFHCALR